jgi:hypothetical protein
MANMYTGMGAGMKAAQTTAKTPAATNKTQVPLAPGVNIDPVTGAVTGGGKNVRYVVVTNPDGTRSTEIYDGLTKIGSIPLSPVASDKKTGSGSGGGYSASSSMAPTEAFADWMGRNPTSAEKNKMQVEGWTNDTIRKYAVTKGGTGPLMQMAINRTRQLAASFYDGDPSGIPGSLINTLISDGTYADETYLKQTYFPMLRGARLTDPNAQAYIDSWVEMTGRPLTQTATDQLDTFVHTYGYTAEAESAWVAWTKTTDSAITGNWGAQHRIAIGNVPTLNYPLRAGPKTLTLARRARGRQPSSLATSGT